MKVLLKDRRKEAVQRLVDKIALPEYVEQIIVGSMRERYINKNTNLRNGFIFCPFHHEVNEPSFSWKKTDNFAYCFGCKTGGNVVRLHWLFLTKIKKLNKNYNEAIIDLAKIYDITIPEFIVDEKTQKEALMEMIQETAQIKRKKISDIMKNRGITITDLEKISKKVMDSDIDLDKKLLKLDYMDQIISISENLKLSYDELIKVIEVL